MSSFLGRKHLKGFDAPKTYKHQRFQGRPRLAAKTAYFGYGDVPSGRVSIFHILVYATVSIFISLV